MGGRRVFLVVPSFSEHNKTLEVKKSQKQRCLRKVHLCRITHHREGEHILAETLPYIGCALECECVV